LEISQEKKKSNEQGIIILRMLTSDSINIQSYLSTLYSTHTLFIYDIHLQCTAGVLAGYDDNVENALNLDYLEEFLLD
jgi:hypothetical protein